MVYKDKQTAHGHNTHTMNNLTTLNNLPQTYDVQPVEVWNPVLREHVPAFEVQLQTKDPSGYVACRTISCYLTRTAAESVAASLVAHHPAMFTI